MSICLPTSLAPAPHRHLTSIQLNVHDLLKRHYPESEYGGFSDVDGTVAFYSRVRALLTPASIVVDVGCGRGGILDEPASFRRELSSLRGSCARVIGVDIDEAGAVNKLVDEFRLIESASWPLETGSADLCVCDWVVEHVEEPSSLFAEAARVLRPGGYLCVRTLNLMSYVGVASRLIPGALHARVLVWAQPQRRRADVFPTAYKCNFRRRLQTALDHAGFDACVYGHNAEPAYFGSSPFLYRLGVWYERYAPRSVAVTLFGFGRRRGDRA